MIRRMADPIRTPARKKRGNVKPLVNKTKLAQGLRAAAKRS